MTSPPFLLGLALIFWGWRIDVLWLGLLMGLVLESTRWLKLRLEFTQQDLDRIWNLCVLLFVGTAALTFAMNDGFEVLNGVVGNNTPSRRLELFNKGAGSALRFLQYLPATLLPIVLAQAFSHRDRFAWSTFSLWLRRQRQAGQLSVAAGAAEEPGGTNLTYPFLATVLFASALAPDPDSRFLPCFAILLGWALWQHRSKTFHAATWVAGLIIAIALGVAAQFGLLELQKVVRHLDNALMSQLSGSGRGYDPAGTRTRMGTVGGLNQSGRIFLRVECPAQQTPPPLLREASYNLYRSTLWAASPHQFVRTLSETVESTWRFVPKADGKSQATISVYLDGGRGLLPIPTGTVRLTDLTVFLLQTNALGAVQVEEGPGFVRYAAHYADGPAVDPPPNDDDLSLPPEERAVLQRLVTEWKLVGTTPTQAIAILRQRFGRDFEYATWRSIEHRVTSNRTALAAFLLDHHNGHCEYFATATTLLLRAAGIPARYAVGYAVQEKKGDSFVVRGRHAHAWGLVWLDGRWQDVDTTPGTWLSLETAGRSFWEPLVDFTSDLWYRFSKWRWGSSSVKQYIIWGLLPALAALAGRILFQKQWRRARTANATGAKVGITRLGLDSELYELERWLETQGLGRPAHETTAQWLRRAENHFPNDRSIFTAILNLHYRHRFDPDGLDANHRRELTESVRTWLKNHSSSPAKRAIRYR